MVRKKFEFVEPKESDKSRSMVEKNKKTQQSAKAMPNEKIKSSGQARANERLVSNEQMALPLDGKVARSSKAIDDNEKYDANEENKSEKKDRNGDKIENEDEIEDEGEAGEMRVAYTKEQVFSLDYEQPNMTQEEKNIRRAIYNEVKRKVKFLEKNNTSKIYVFRDWRIPWFKAGGNSALFYAFDIAGRAGKRNVNVNVDRDGHAVFKDGVVSFNQTEHLFNYMEKAGLKEPKVIENGWILVFDTEHTYSKDEIKDLRRASLRRRRDVNNIVLTENVYPHVYNNLLTLIKRVSPNIYKLNANQRKASSQMVLDRMIEMHVTYLEMADGRLSPIKGANKLLSRIDWFMSLMKILMEGGFWDMSICAPIGQVLADLKESVKSDIIKTENKKLERERLDDEN